MGLVVFVLGFTVLCTILGYTVSSLHSFAESRVFRVISYLLVALSSTVISIIVFMYFDPSYVDYGGGGTMMDDGGRIGGAMSFWYYFGTIMRGEVYQKFKYRKLKKFFGILMLVFGLITTVAFFIRGMPNQYPIDYLFLWIFLGVSQLVFGFSLIRSSKSTILMSQHSTDKNIV